MAETALVQTRIDPEIRDKAQKVLESVGMTVSEAVRVLLTRTANEGALPFAQPEGEAYDAWFRAQVRKALYHSRGTVSHEEAKALMADRKKRILQKASER